MTLGSGPTFWIFRLNDYDFGEGVAPTVSYATLPQFIYGIASTASEISFPCRRIRKAVQLSQPGCLRGAGHLLWRITKTLT